MTIALCMQYGSLQNGAYLECPECGEGPTGNDTLDLLLNDHYLNKEEPSRLDSLWNSLRQHTDDFDAPLYAFYYLCSEYHPDMISVDIPEKLREHAFEGVHMQHNRWIRFPVLCISFYCIIGLICSAAIGQTTVSEVVGGDTFELSNGGNC